MELQLGSTDESHIIRTIEHWDMERKRYPQYDHCAVIVAEDITSRFLNVVSLFNGAIPLIAIQMQAFKVGEHVTLVFTTVLDELSRGLVDEDEEAEAAAAPTDRSYWTSRGSKATLAMVDQLLAMLKEIDPSLELKYNKFYVGLAKDGQVDNFVSFRPRKNSLIFDVRLPQLEEVDAKLTEAGLEALEYNSRWRRYAIRLGKDDISKHSQLLKMLMRCAYDIDMRKVQHELSAKYKVTSWLADLPGERAPVLAGLFRVHKRATVMRSANVQGSGRISSSRNSYAGFRHGPAGD